MNTASMKEFRPKIELLSQTSGEWLETALHDFDGFLIDHATCERKASATAISFTVAYPDRFKLIDEMIGLAREELQHFHQVMRIMIERRLTFKKDEKNPYVQGMINVQRHGREERFLDRLLIFGIAEARGQERFQMISDGLKDVSLKNFYRKLAAAEGRHQFVFVDLALEYFDPAVVDMRTQELLQIEAELVERLPRRAAVH